MRKQYIVPETDIVNVHLISSVLQDETIPIETGSPVGTTIDSKEQTFDDWDDVTMNRPRNINLWEE